MKRIANNLVFAIAGFIAGGALVKKVWLEKYHEQKAKLAVAENERELFYDWLLMKENGRSLADFFDKYNLKRVAILGMNRLGRLAAEELGERAVYCVEAENFSAVHERLTVYRLGEDPLPEADCMLLCDLEVKQSVVRNEFSGGVITLTEALQWDAENARDKAVWRRDS